MLIGFDRLPAARVCDAADAPELGYNRQLVLAGEIVANVMEMDLAMRSGIGIFHQ